MEEYNLEKRLTDSLKSMGTLSSGNKRYAFLTAEQQNGYDALPDKMQKFIRLVAQGMTKKGAYIAAGYKDSKNASDGAKKMQSRHPIVKELIEAFRGHNTRYGAMDEDSEVAKKIDKIAKKAEKKLPVLPNESALVEKGVDLTKVSAAQAESYNFYRDIWEGKVQNEKVTERRDADGNLLNFNVEKTTTIDQRIKAREKMDEILGIHESLAQIGEVTMGQITVKIIDARRDEDKEEIVAEEGDYSMSEEEGGEENGRDD